MTTSLSPNTARKLKTLAALAIAAGTIASCKHPAPQNSLRDTAETGAAVEHSFQLFYKRADAGYCLADCRSTTTRALVGQERPQLCTGSHAKKLETLNAQAAAHPEAAQLAKLIAGEGTLLIPDAFRTERGSAYAALVELFNVQENDGPDDRCQAATTFINPQALQAMLTEADRKAYLKANPIPSDIVLTADSAATMRDRLKARKQTPGGASTSVPAFDPMLYRSVNFPPAIGRYSLAPTSGGARCDAELMRDSASRTLRLSAAACGLDLALSCPPEGEGRCTDAESGSERHELVAIDERSFVVVQYAGEPLQIAKSYAGQLK